MSTMTVTQLPVLAGRVWCGEQRQARDVSACRTCAFGHGISQDDDGWPVVACGSPAAIAGPVLAHPSVGDRYAALEWGQRHARDAG